MRRCLLLAVLVLLPGCTVAAWKNLGFNSSGTKQEASAEQPTGAQAQKTVEAQKFVVVDAKGKPLAELGVTPVGTGLALLDASGKARAALILTGPNEPGLRLYDQRGVVRAAVVVSNNGGSGLALYDATGRNRASLLMTADGSPGLVLFDRFGRPIVVIPTRAPPPSPPYYRH